MSEGSLREPAIVFALFLVASWVLPLVPAWTVPAQTALGAAVAAGLFWSALRDGVPLSDLGLRLDNLPRSTLAFVAATGALLAPLLPQARSIEPGEIPTYFAWASFQQFLVVLGFWRHFRKPLGGRRRLVGELGPAWLTAAVFALAHAPNLPLMALVALGETLWLALFARFRNLLSLSLVHALSALVVSHSLPPHWLSSMRVGLSYWRP